MRTIHPFIAVLACIPALAAISQAQNKSVPRPDLESPDGKAPENVRALIEQLQDTDEFVRLKAAKQLGVLKNKAKDAIPALTKVAKGDPDDDVRAIAVKSLTAIKEAAGIVKGNEKAQSLIKDLQSKDSRVRIAALEKLGEMGPDAADAGSSVVEFGIMSRDEKVREAALSAFEKIDKTVYKHVLIVAIDQNEYKKMEAVLTLGEMGGKAKASLPLIKRFFAQFPRELMIDSAGTPYYQTIGSLASIAPDDKGVQAITLGLVGGADVLQNPRWQFSRGLNRNAVIYLMNQTSVDNKQKYKALMSGLNSTQRDAVIIIKELGKLGKDAKGALPTLNKLRLNPNGDIRTAANEAIAAIKDE